MVSKLTLGLKHPVEIPKNIQVQEVQKALTRCARDVHLLEAPALEDADGQLPGGGDISVN